MASWRDDGDGAYEPDVKDEWTRVKYEFGEACEADDGGEEEDPESETARERRCANRLMDMVEKDVHACVPALEMMQRMDQNIDAFEAFVDDMERRFALGTLPKRDVLGDKYLFRWRFFVLSVFGLRDDFKEIRRQLLRKQSFELRLHQVLAIFVVQPPLREW